MKLGTIIGLFCACHIAMAEPVLEEAVEQSYQIEPRSTLSIRNSDGSIRVYGSDSTELKVQAIKRAYSAERLSKIAVTTSVQPGQISIETQYPPAPKLSLSDRSGTVDYIILLPWTCDISRLDLANGEVLIEGMRGGHVHASLGNGRLFAHNCFTDLEVSVGNGAIDLGYDWWESHKFAVNAQIANGNARAFIPGDAAFHLLVSSVNGGVASDFTDKEHRKRGGVRKIDMVVGGDSAAEIKLSAVNGSIKINESNP
jgi:hypothetical protein